MVKLTVSFVLQFFLDVFVMGNSKTELKVHLT